MKKLALTIAILIGLSLGAFAQGGLFGYGDVPSSENTQAGNRDGVALILPGSHGSDDDQTGTPVGSGVLLLIGFGAAYALKQRKNK